MSAFVPSTGSAVHPLDQSAGALPFTGPALLAPMDGITDTVYRELVLARHRPEDLGGAFTEFVRITEAAISKPCLKRHLGSKSFPMPVGLQLMGNNAAAMATTARRAVELGAPIIDINFGCPAKGALRTCAGSALLSEPSAVERIIRACVDAVPSVPVSAKIRAGIEHDRDLEAVVSAVEAGGASLLTIHCRTRLEGYDDRAIDWKRIRRAVETTSLPVCGNGGVSSHSDIERMRRETGCRYVMVGRAALRDPWIFAGRKIDRAEAARFFLDYRDAMRAAGGGTNRQRGSRLKQLLRYWTAGDLVGPDRLSWLREPDHGRLVARIESAASSSVAT